MSKYDIRSTIYNSRLFLLIFICFNCPFPVNANDSLITDYRLEISTFLGNNQRNYYGNLAPEKLDILWKHRLGSGKTKISSRGGDVVWSGCGWTGQPLLIRIRGKAYLIQGAYDHHLKMIDASNGKLVWQYKFDDVIKGTGSIWVHPNPESKEEQWVILQGSRRGVQNSHYSNVIPSFRAIALLNGNEKWRMNVSRTKSYSRDVDASPLFLKDTAYANLENGTFVVIDPDPDKIQIRDSILQPVILQEHLLFTNHDVRRHGGNLVTESSPGLLGDHIYIAAGSGHIYGYNTKTDSIDWDFYIGSDIDGSPVITEDGCLIVTIEQQYIKGQGGMMKLDPTQPADERAVVWFLPTRKSKIGSWIGGVIGSACTNEATRFFYHPRLAACLGIDGYLYLVQHDQIDSTRKRVKGPNLKNLYYQPKIIARRSVGAGISTPIIVGDRLVVAGYSGIYLFQITRDLRLVQLDRMKTAAFEATPIVHYGKVYVGSRNGFLYCLGERREINN